MSDAIIGVIDYGMGNLHSVTKALAEAGATAQVISSAALLEDQKLAGIVMPGVGHFGEAMKQLSDARLIEPLKKYLSSGKPFLGICLGLQTLFESSEEAPGINGLGYFKGTVRRFPSTIDGKKVIIPAIGWNEVNVREDSLDLIEPGERFYFVHSYFAAPNDRNIIVAEAEYGLRYTVAVRNGAVLATQFHPEKSGSAGISMLRNWVLQISQPGGRS